MTREDITFDSTAISFSPDQKQWKPLSEFLKPSNPNIDCGPYSEINTVDRIARIRRLLKRAIEDKKQVTLVNYSSYTGHSDMRNRVVEPVNFVSNGEGVGCFEIETHKTKQFSLVRIEDVIISDCGWKYESEHIELKTDIFNWSGSACIRLRLDMTDKARKYLQATYSSAKHLSSDQLRIIRKNIWRLDVMVTDINPVVRFYAHWLDEITIVDTPELQDAFDEYIEKNSVSVKMSENYTSEQQQAILSLLGYVMKADDEINQYEKRYIGKYFSKFNISFFDFDNYSKSRATDIVRTMTDKQKNEVLLVLNGLAASDHIVHIKEVEEIKSIFEA